MLLQYLVMGCLDMAFTIARIVAEYIRFSKIDLNEVVVKCQYISIIR